MANEAPDIDLDKLFREKRKQSKEFKGKDKIPSNDDFKFYEQYLPLYNEGGDARRSIPNLSRFEKIRKMIMKVDDVEPMKHGGKVKKPKAKKMMGGGKVYSRGSRKAKYNG